MLREKKMVHWRENDIFSVVYPTQNENVWIAYKNAKRLNMNGVIQLANVCSTFC